MTSEPRRRGRYIDDDELAVMMADEWRYGYVQGYLHGWSDHRSDHKAGRQYGEGRILHNREDDSDELGT